MEKNKFQKYVYSAVFAALTFVSTYLIKIPIPSSGGYIHPGDGVYLAAAILAGPFAGAFAGGIGSAAADIAGGFIPYVIPTFIIKALSGYIVGKAFENKDAENFKKISGFAAYTLILLAGYFIADYIVTGTLAACIPSLFFNIIQAAAGIFFAILISGVIGKTKR